MQEKTLVLIFVNQGGGQVRMNVSDVREDITGEEVKSVMDTIVARDIFDTGGGSLAAASGAEIVTRTVQELPIA